MIRLFEECLGIRRAILLKYKLRDLAHVYSRPASPGALSVGNNSRSSHGTRSTASRRMGPGGGSVSPLVSYSTASRRNRHVSANSPEQRRSQQKIGTNGQATSPRNPQSSNSPQRRQAEKSELLEKAKLARELIMAKGKLRDEAKAPGRPPVSPGMLTEGNGSISSVGIQTTKLRQVDQGGSSEVSLGGKSLTLRRLEQGGDSISSFGDRSSPNSAGQGSERRREPGGARRTLADSDSATVSSHNKRSSASSRARMAAKTRSDLLELSTPLRLHDSSDFSGEGTDGSSPRLSPTGRTRRTQKDCVPSRTSVPSISPLGSTRRSLPTSPASVEKIATKSPGRRAPQRINNFKSSMEHKSAGSSVRQHQNVSSELLELRRFGGNENPVNNGK